jgi:hypothetical protein
MSRINAMGTNLIIIRPGAARFRRRDERHAAESHRRDAEALLTLRASSPFRRWSMAASRSSTWPQNTSTNIMGVAATYFEIANYEVDEGEFFTDADTEVRMGRVAVLGPVKTVDNLFVDSDPIGKTIKINGINFRGHRHVQEQGRPGMVQPGRPDSHPYRTAIKELFGVTSTTPNSIRRSTSRPQDGVGRCDQTSG